jgi:protein-S-isoprenylcysteine O-methyltransferase Ste14
VRRVHDGGGSNVSNRLPPVAVAVSFGLAMWLVARALPMLRFDFQGRRAAALALLALGAGISLAGVIEFRRARTTTNPLRPGAASSLVVTGIYTRTRNPMYLGFAVTLLAWSTWLAHPVTLLGIAGFVAWMNRFQIVAEETAIAALFGAEFERYRNRVRRWI